MGDVQLPKVESNADLKAALSLMGGLRQSQVPFHAWKRYTPSTLFVPIAFGSASWVRKKDPVDLADESRRVRAMCQVAAVEVLWTPQQEGDTLTANEVMTDYPKLIPL